MNSVCRYIIFAVERFLENSTLNIKSFITNMIVKRLMMNDKKLTSFLFVVEGVGAIFVGVFLAAYLGGLFYTPQTTVLHSEWTWTFRIPLAIFGVLLLVLVLATVVLAVFHRKNK